ncbi:type IX secretion system periplasmic lipoprotein PorW/SprE [Sinomicrobium sp. M5D2P9]
MAIVSFFAVTGCSTEKDAFLNRNFHALTSKYNVLYNGKNALNEGREGLITSYTDNFWDVLPVERMEVVEEKALSGGANNPSFERAEEKAAKAIQKHGMNIRGRERNPQMDEAYLLLGIGRYYDQRFIPAMEAFNYILDKYPDSDKYRQARIWREKTNIRLESEELALENLKDFVRGTELKEQEYADVSAAMAQAYINLQHKDSAVRKLKIAATLTKKNEEKGRYNYIIGQLYDALENKDSANLAYGKVIALKRKSPRTYMINAELQKMRNTEISDSTEREERLEFLDRMENNRENRPFLDKIYHYIADFHKESDSIRLAEEYLNKSLRANADDWRLKAMCYEELAEMNFDRNEYKNAGAYYDSTLIQLKDDRRKIRAIQKKRDNLEDVIRYEDIVYVNDSILHLVSLPESERVAYFETYIEGIRAEDEKRREEEERAAENGSFNPFDEQINTIGQATEGGKFYFYNQIALGHGKTSFRKMWGDRELQDNWRLSNKSMISRQDSAEETQAEIVAMTPDERYDVHFYLDRLPTDEQVLDSLKTERDFANYQLGLIYKEKFKEYPLAIGKLETVLDSDPEEKLVLPSKYHLFRLYEIEGSDKMAGAKEDIIKNHPGSRYAEILENPEAVLAGEANDPETYFTSLYKKFETQQYETVLQETEKYIKQHTGEEIIPRMEMLRATSLGRLYGLDSFREALNAIALNYPNDDVGKEAQRKLDEAAALGGDAFMAGEEEPGRWKLILPVQKNNIVGTRELMENMEYFSLKYPYFKNLKVSWDVYDKDTAFVVVHGLRNSKDAKAYRELINNDKECVINTENFLILSPDYRTVQVHKNVGAFRNKGIQQEP